MYIYTVLLTMRDTMAYQNTDFSSLDILYILIIGLCILLRVYQSIYIETSVRTNVGARLYCALLTLHSAIR
jgi:hypothetical protein